MQRSKLHIYVAVVSVLSVAAGLFLCPFAIHSGVCKSRDAPIIGVSSHVDKTLDSGQVATPLYLLTQARATLFKKLQIMLNNRDGIVLSKSSTNEDLKRYFTAVLELSKSDNKRSSTKKVWKYSSLLLPLPLRNIHKGGTEEPQTYRWRVFYTLFGTHIGIVPPWYRLMAYRPPLVCYATGKAMPYFYCLQIFQKCVI